MGEVIRDLGQLEKADRFRILAGVIRLGEDSTGGGGAKRFLKVFLDDAFVLMEFLRTQRRENLQGDLAERKRAIGKDSADFVPPPLLTNGVDALTVAFLAGHADPKTTLKAYARVNRGRMLKGLAVSLDLGAAV